MTSPTDLAERLREIRERAEDATPGPWRADSWSRCRCDVNAYSERAPGGRYLIASLDYADGPGDDADFIAHAREDIPWLLDRLSALESAASGEVTEVIRALRIARVCEHPGCHDECGGLQPPIMAVAADLLERLGPRLAKAEQRCKDAAAYLWHYDFGNGPESDLRKAMDILAPSSEPAPRRARTKRRDLAW